MIKALNKLILMTVGDPRAGGGGGACSERCT